MPRQGRTERGAPYTPPCSAAEEPARGLRTGGASLAVRALGVPAGPARQPIEPRFAVPRVLVSPCPFFGIRMHGSQIGGSSGIPATAGTNPDRGGDATHPMAGGLPCLGAPAPCRAADLPATVILRTAGATLAKEEPAARPPAAPRAATVGRGQPGRSGISRGRVRVTDASRYEASAVSTAAPFSREDEAGPDVCGKPPGQGGVQRGDSDAGTPHLKRKWDGEPKKGGNKEGPRTFPQIVHQEEC